MADRGIPAGSTLAGRGAAPGSVSPAVVGATPSGGGVAGSGGAGPAPTAAGSQAHGLSPFSGAFSTMGGLYSAPFFQQVGAQPTYSAAPRPVSSRISVSQPGAIPGAPWTQHREHPLVSFLRNFLPAQGVM